MPNDKEKPKEKEEKPKGPTTLESIVNEQSQLLKGVINTAIGTGAIALSTKYFGLDGLVTALSFPYGGMIEKRLMTEKDESKKQFTSKHIRDEAIAGTAFTVPLWYGINYLRGLPKAFGIDGLINVLGYSIPATALATAGLTFASIPLFNAIYYPIKYLADNKTFKGMGKDFKENYWKGTKRALGLGLLWSPVVAASVAMPALYPYLFPILAGFEVAYRVILSKEKLNYAKLLNPLTYIPFASNLAEGTGSLIRRGYGLVYRLGSGIRSTIDDLVKSSPKPAPSRPEPVPQTA